MAWGGGEQGSTGEPPLTFELQVLRNKDRMTLARAQHKPDEYWVYFDTIMGDMVSFMSPPIRAKLEARHDILLKKVETIRDSSIHRDSKEKEISDLRVAFADENKYYLSKALSRTNIVTVKDEGLVDLDKETIDGYASAIRGNQGIDETLARMEAKPEDAAAKELDDRAAKLEEERMRKLKEAQEKHVV